MESEFLELIKTFEKTVVRLETLDTTILGFKDIVENLRGNLDELVEMVQLEEIVELSQQSIERLKGVQEQCHNMASTYDQAINRLENQVDVFSKFVAAESESIAGDFLYQLNEQTKEVSVVSKGQANQAQVIKDLKAKKIFSDSETTFVLNATETALYVLNGENAVLLLRDHIKDFVVYHYKLYALVNNELIRYHLLTKEKTSLLNNLERIRLLGDGSHLLCQSQNEVLTYIKL